MKASNYNTNPVTFENSEEKGPKPLVIDLSEEYKIKIEGPEELKQSFFEDIYRKAAKAVEDIVSHSEKWAVNVGDPVINEQQDYNNIIAFCGERGTGKSSAMISFANGLLGTNKVCDTIFRKKIKEKTFKSLSVIDPSLFEEGENIFEVILAQLFSRFEDELKKKNQNTSIDLKRKVLEQFEKVYENLQTIKKNGQKYDGDALETLSKLACGANLRDNFKVLINLFLEFISESASSTYLIIPIDDFDLNINAVADMAEQIRKYLMIPRVIVLMAANIDLLRDAKEQSIRLAYKGRNAEEKNWHEQAQKYLLKFIPVERRLHLSLTYIDNIKDRVLQIKGASDFDSKICNVSIEKTILALLYQRTGVLLLVDKNKSHLFIPRTLRELRALINFLVDLPSGNKQVSINLFSSYFRNNWIFENLLPEYGGIFNIIFSQPTSEHRKQIVVQTVNYFTNLVEGKTKIIMPDYDCLFKKEDNRSVNLTAEIREIINRTNQARNVSLGDVLLFINELESVKCDVQFSKYVFAIKLFLSIELNRISYEKMDENELFSYFGTFIYSPKIDLMRQIRTLEGNNPRHYFEFDYDDFRRKYYSELNFRLIEFIHLFIPHFGVIPKLYRSKDDFEFSTENFQTKKRAYFNITSFVVNSLIYPRIVEPLLNDFFLSENFNAEYNIKSVDFRKAILLFCNVEFIESLFIPSEIKRNNLGKNDGISFYIGNFIEKINAKYIEIENDNLALDLYNQRDHFLGVYFHDMFEKLSVTDKKNLDSVFINAMPNAIVVYTNMLIGNIKTGLERYHRFNMQVNSLLNDIKRDIRSRRALPNTILSKLQNEIENRVILYRQVQDNFEEGRINASDHNNPVNDATKDFVLNQETEREYVRTQIDDLREFLMEFANKLEDE